jgi:hypothetical protein
MVSSVPLNSPLHVGLCKPRVLARDLGTTLSMKQGTSYTPAVTDMVTRVLELHLRREGVDQARLPRQPPISPIEVGLPPTVGRGR